MAAARRSSSAAMVAAALLACTIRAALAYSICDNVTCAMGRCAEAPGLIPGTVGYECDCQSGWSRVFDLPFTPCMIPNCIDPACFNITVSLPRGVPITDICVAVDCGAGACRNDGGMKFHCDCDPGYQNVLNVTFLPCITNCAYDGQGCIRPVLSPSPSPPPPPPPPANDGSSGPTPSSSKGPVSLLLLLLVSLACTVADQVMRIL